MLGIKTHVEEVGLFKMEAAWRTSTPVDRRCGSAEVVPND
jgi:hypothetical protein